MGKFVTNEEIMQAFKDIEFDKYNDDLSKEKISRRQDGIIKKMKFLVYRHTNKYRFFSNYEDLVQEGFRALVIITQNFNYKLYPNFFVYSEKYIRRAIAKAASRFDIVYSPNKTRVVYSHNPYLSADRDIDHITPEYVLEQHDVSVQIFNALDKFSDRDSDIVKRLFGLGQYQPHTLREIGPIHNISYECARLIKNKVIDKLKKSNNLLDLY